MNRHRTIVKIYTVPVTELAGVRKSGIDSVTISTSVPLTELQIRVPARLTLSDAKVDGVRMYSAQLVFRTCEDMKDVERMAYVCETANGESYLIGDSVRPYPVTTTNQVLPDNVTDSQLTEVTVNYSSRRKVPLID